MERKMIAQEISDKITALATIHITYRLERTPAFAVIKGEIEDCIRENHIDVKNELDPVTQNLYRRYFC